MNRWQHFKCGLHSGFPLCCVLSFITIWIFSSKRQGKYFKWVNDRMNKTEPVNPVPHIYDKINKQTYKTYDYRYVEDFKHWGMIPCVFHLLLKRRPVIKACFCHGEPYGYTDECKQKLLKNHKHMVARHLWNQ